MVYIAAVSGYKNSGKTTLCRKLISRLRKLGIRTGYIKRTSEEVLSAPGTDTGSVTESGFGALLWGTDGVRYELGTDSGVSPQLLASRYFPDAEIVIMEGGKDIGLPKIWVRGTKDEAVPDYPGIFMVYDRHGAGDLKKTFSEGDEDAIAERLSGFVRGQAYRSSSVYIGDKPLPMKAFIADFISGGILGMLASLKGASDPKEPIRIYIDPGVKDRTDTK